MNSARAEHPPSLLILRNAVIFDGESDQLIDGGSVVVEGGLIREVATGDIKLAHADVIDLGGRFLMPGLIDLHFHAYSASANMQVLDRMPKPLLISHAIRLLEGALSRGFTTVRDPGGGDVGLCLAIERGLIEGPRLLYGGRALSQTGGHGDLRPADQEELCNCSYSGVICQVVDGVDQVRRVAREELRRGADHIKIFISGGVSSPTDPLWMPQFTNEELQAAVQEARTRRKYVAAHCHTDDGAQRCVKNGIRSIEHATTLSEETARMIAESGTTYTVPTMAVMHQVIDHGKRLGIFPESLHKAHGLIDQCKRSLEVCARAGVKMGLGTDIFGADYHYMQASEFRYRAEVGRSIDVLRSATSINAEIVQRKGEVGTIAPGAAADLIVLDRSPLEDITVFERFATSMPMVMKGGRMIRNMLV